MPDVRIERGACRFVAKIVEGGRPAIILQFFHASVPLLRHAMLSFNLLCGLTLEQGKNLADTLNENVLDASVAVSSDHPLFAGELSSTFRSS